MLTKSDSEKQVRPLAIPPGVNKSEVETFEWSQVTLVRVA